MSRRQPTKKIRFPDVPTHTPKILTPAERQAIRRIQQQKTEQEKKRFQKATRKLREEAIKVQKEVEKQQEEVKRREKELSEKAKKREFMRGLLEEDGWIQERIKVPGFEKFEKWTKQGKDALYLPPITEMKMELQRDLNADQSSLRQNLKTHSKWLQWVDMNDKRFPGKGYSRELWYNPQQNEHFLIDSINFDDRRPDAFKEGKNFWRVPKRGGGRRHKTKRVAIRKGKKVEKKRNSKTHKKGKKQHKRKTRRH
jgi:hypothetical protein